MATRVYTVENIILQDDKEVVLRPLPIAPLRRFQEAWNKIAELPEGDDGFNVFINCCGIALEKNYKGEFESLRPTKEQADDGAVLSDAYREYLEETLELDTIYKILDVCGGVKFNDPKLLAEAEKAMEKAQEELGKN